MRTRRLAALSLLTLSISLPGLAREAADARRPGRYRFRECLAILDLSDQQKTDILGILEAARPALEADAAAVAAAREALRAALDAPAPEACAVGSATLDVQAAVGVLTQERDSVRGQIEAPLSPDQVSRFEGCLEAPLRRVIRGEEAAD